MPEHAQQQKSKSAKEEPFDAAAVIQDLRVGASRASAESLSKARDNLDFAVSVINELTPTDRRGLGMKCKLDAFSLGLNASLAERVSWSPIDKPEPDKNAEGLRAMARVLLSDVNGKHPKEYEVAVKQVWKVTKATLDETLNRPEVRALLADKPVGSKK